MRLKILFFGIILLLQNDIMAQDSYLNESKYWFYRYRLLTEFLVQGQSNCGEGSGLTIPCGSAYLKPERENDEFSCPQSLSLEDSAT